jgi:hypothetical protein
MTATPTRAAANPDEQPAWLAGGQGSTYIELHRKHQVLQLQNTTTHMATSTSTLNPSAQGCHHGAFLPPSSLPSVLPSFLPAFLPSLPSSLPLSGAHPHTQAGQPAIRLRALHVAQQHSYMHVRPHSCMLQCKPCHGGIAPVPFLSLLIVFTTIPLAQLQPGSPLRHAYIQAPGHTPVQPCAVSKTSAHAFHTVKCGQACRTCVCHTHQPTSLYVMAVIPTLITTQTFRKEMAARWGSGVRQPSCIGPSKHMCRAQASRCARWEARQAPKCFLPAHQGDT